MFGYAAFAQPPFASLGGTFISVFVTENITSADIEASTIVTFVTAISEGLNVADISAAIQIHNTLISENITLEDIKNPIFIYNVTAAEPISVSDVTNCFGFGTIDNSQSTNWVLIDNRQ